MRILINRLSLKTMITAIFQQRQTRLTTLLMLIVGLCLTGPDMMATHIVGGEISTTVIRPASGPGDFAEVRLRLTVRRDCVLGLDEAIFDNPAYVKVYFWDGTLVEPVPNSISNSRIELQFMGKTTVDETLDGVCEVLGNTVCVEEAIYERVVQIKYNPNQLGYNFIYQRCCRNSSLNNIVDPLNAGMTLVREMYMHELTTGNRTPKLPEFPPIYACVGTPWVIQQGALTADPDGHELRYRLNTPYIGASQSEPQPANAPPPPYGNVEWEAGYSQGNLLNTSVPMTIDPVTGELSVTPEAVGQFLISFCMEELDTANRATYTTCREFELNVRACGDIALAQISEAPTLQCGDLDVHLSGEGSIGDSITWVIDGQTIVTDVNDLDLDYTFAEGGTYTVYLWANNTVSGECYDVDSVTFTLVAGTGGSGLLEFETVVDSCDGDDLVITAYTTLSDSLDPHQDITWYVIENGDTIYSNIDSAIHFAVDINSDITICQTAILSNGCPIENCQTFDAGFPDPEFEVVVTECVDSLAVIVINSTVNMSEYDIVGIEWTILDGSTVIATGSDTSISFTLQDEGVYTVCQGLVLDNGCVVEECEDVTLNFLTLDYEREVPFCIDEDYTIEIRHSKGDPITIVWSDPDSLIKTISNDGQSIVIFTSDTIDQFLHFIATNEYGCSVEDSVRIYTVGKRPDLSFVVSQDECGTLDIRIVNTSEDMVDVIWDFGDGSDPDSTLNPTHTYASSGTYTITMTGGVDPCVEVLTKTIQIPLIDVDFPDTMYQCFGDSLTLNPGGNENWTYIWSPSELFSDTSATSPKILVDEVTVVYVYVVATDGDDKICAKSDTIVIVPIPDYTFNVLPTGDENGEIAYCGEADSLWLYAERDSDVVVVWKDDSGNILGMGDSLQVDLSSGNSVTITAMGMYNGVEECVKTESRSITIMPLDLSFDITNLDDGTDMFCSTPANGLIVVTHNGPAGNYTYEWSPLDNVVSGADTDSLRITVDANITYCVTVTNVDAGCEASDCVDIELGAQVTAVVLDDDGIICAGDTICVQAEVLPENVTCDISWDVAGNTIIGPDDQATICYIASNSHTVTVAVGCPGGCTDQDQVEITLRDLSSLIQATADPDSITSDDDIIQLDVDGADSDWDFMWDGPGTIDNTNIKNPTTVPGAVESQTYTVNVTDEYGCEGSSSVTLRVPENVACEYPYVFVPTAFSPNNDGQNETLDVYGRDLDEILTFIIYNRWGQEMYRVDNVPSASWDGRYKGELLPADVYGYYLHARCENGDESQQQGNISLIR